MDLKNNHAVNTNEKYIYLEIDDLFDDDKDNYYERIISIVTDNSKLLRLWIYIKKILELELEDNKNLLSLKEKWWTCLTRFTIILRMRNI